LAPGFSTIYWPIETKVRELDAALLFAVLGAQRGWSVVVGGKTELYGRLKQNAEPGILVDKSIQKGSERLFAPLRKRGHRVFARCEEAMYISNPEEYCSRKTGREAFHEVEAVLALGRHHADALHQVYPQYSQKVVTTGNVRFDLLTPAVRAIHEREASRLREQWGEFYLLNTKLVKVNPSVEWGAGYLERSIARKHVKTEEHIQLLAWRVELEKGVLAHTVDFVERFAKELPGERLIIRPHPAEGFALWRNLSRGKTNIHVVHEGSVLPWLMAGKLSISSDCTTSVEAYLLDKPGINFRPIEAADEVEWELPKIVAYQVASTDALLSALAQKDPRSGLALPSTLTDEIVRKHFAQHGRRLASESILDYFDGLYRARNGSNGIGHDPLGKVDPAYVALQRLKVLVAWCISKHNRNRHRNRVHKIRGLEMGEIAERVEHVCRTLGYKSVLVKKLAPNIFHIFRTA